jgi:hypothetical protein
MQSKMLWSRSNLRRGVGFLWASIASVAGLIDILGMVVVAFLLELIPGVERVAELAWFKPTVIVVGVLFLAFHTALRAAAEIEALREADAARESDFERKYRSLHGDLRGLMDQVRQCEAGKVIPTRKIEQRWPGFEFVNPILDDIDRNSDDLAAILQRSHSSNETGRCVGRLREMADEATRRLEQLASERRQRNRPTP